MMLDFAALGRHYETIHEESVRKAKALIVLPSRNIMVQLMHLVLISLATACDYTLYAEPQNINIWARVAEIDSVKSPFVLCLAGSTPTKHFTMDDTTAGCIWGTTHLIIQYFLHRSLCEQDNCEKQTIWLQGAQPCQPPSDLSFVNVTLSGRHHFTENCEEGEDWCTHCLNPELLVEENDNYYTVIEHHSVPLDSSYEKWQSKCLWSTEAYVFVLRDVVLTIEDSVIADMRYKMYSFAWLANSSLSLIRSQIIRMDPASAFFYCDNSPNSFILMEDCYVTGLNRDHIYSPEVGSDAGFLIFWGALSLTIVRCTFAELICQSPLNYQMIMSSEVDFYLITDTLFTRCVGILLELSSKSSASLKNVSLERNYAEFVMAGLYTDMGTLSLMDCKFIDNVSKAMVLIAQVTEVISGVYKNNRHLGWTAPNVFWFQSINHLPVHVENTVFEENAALDLSFEPYWSDYYLAKGLLTDSGLSAEKTTALSSSLCKETVFFQIDGDLEIINAAFTNIRSTCDYLAWVNLHLSARFLLYDVQVSTPMKIAVYIQSDGVSVAQINNSLFERAAVLLGVGGNVDLSVSNATFQYASRDDTDSAPVILNSPTSSFFNCSWRHNQGQLAGALKVFGRVEIRVSEFRNNSGWSAGDIWFSPQNFTMVISSCTFTASNSSLSAASILVLGALESSNVSDCIFSEFDSVPASIIKAAHNSGHLALSNLTFLNIHSPSAILILITVPVAATLPVSTSIVKLKVSNSSFYKGIATDRGNPIVQNAKAYFTENNGVAIWIQTGRFNDSNSVFEANTGAGLYFFGSDTVSSLNNCSFRGNYPNETMGVLYVEGPNTQVLLQNCEFTNNVAKEASGVVQLLRAATISFDACNFSRNQGRNSLIFMQSSSLFLKYCNFSDSFDVLRLEDSIAQVLFTTFIRMNSTASMFVLTRSLFTLRSASFSEIQGNSLLSARSSTISFTNITIQELASRKESLTLHTSLFSLLRVDMNAISCFAAVISSVNTVISMIDVKITNSCAQVVKAQSSDLSLRDCLFTSIQTKQEVGVLSCTDCDQLTLENTTMLHLEAQSIGAIYVSAANVTIHYSSFAHISAEHTGAIRVTARVFELLSSNFSHIVAKGPVSSGGAVLLSGGQFTIAKSSFEENRAWTGGAVQWTSGSMTEQDNYFRDNIAGFYGPNWASFPHALYTSSPFVYLHLERKLVVYLVDHYGQVVLTDSSSHATLSTSESAMLSGQLQTVASSGQFVFSEFSSFAEPGSNFTATVTANQLNLKVTFLQRVCALGEIYKNKTCERCRTGTYTLAVKGTVCEQCPVGAECREGHKLYPKLHYWRPHLHFPRTLSCPRPQSCTGHNNYTSQTGLCADLYTGPLCQICQQNAHRRGRDHCAACSSALWLPASFICVGLPIFWSIQALASTRENNRLGVLLRLLVDYVQLMALVIDYDLSWPTPLEDVYLLHRYLGNALQTCLPLDCLYSDAFYKSIIAAALAPFAVVVFLTSIWGVLMLILYSIRYSVTTLRAIFINVIIVGQAYIYPFIVRVAFSAFLCETIESEEQWVRANLAVRCWDQQHLKYLLAASLPSLLLWGIGLPAFAGLYIARGRKLNRGKPSHASFLWGGFKDQFSLWEVGIGLCKASVAVLYVFTAKMTPGGQALALVAMLSFVLLLQRLYHPYTEAVYNRVSLLSLGVVWMTVYAGLYFSATNPTILLSILVCFIHLWFFLSWIVILCGARFTSLLWVLCLSRKQSS